MPPYRPESLGALHILILCPVSSTLDLVSAQRLYVAKADHSFDFMTKIYFMIFIQFLDLIIPSSGSFLSIFPLTYSPLLSASSQNYYKNGALKIYITYWLKMTKIYFHSFRTINWVYVR